MERLHIVVDTREQRPWGFDVARVRTSVGTLATGDYALYGDTSFAIERKSIDDFLGTLSSGWERFSRELWRMADWPARVVIVEGDFETFCFTEHDGTLSTPSHRHSRLSPGFVMMRLSQLTMANVSVLFAGDADLAAGLAYMILRERAKRWTFCKQL